MTVTTKFSVGDLVYLIYDNKIQRETIFKIYVKIYNPRTDPSIIYIFDIIDNDNDDEEPKLHRYEHQIAKTKEELVELLFNQFQKDNS